MERWGWVLFDFVSRALPRWLRKRAGEAMRASFAQRQREILAYSGAAALISFWIRECVGLLQTAYRSRHPDDWARRTKPRTASSATPGSKSLRNSMRNLIADLRFAVRSFMRRPAVGLLAVVNLSLGIGASTAMFSVIESVLLQPLPYPEPENLYSVYPAWPELRGHPTLGDLADRGTWSWPEFFTVAEQQSAFASLAAWQNFSVTLSGDGRPERISMTEVTHEFFSMLGVNALLGRLFDAGDGVDGSENVVVLSAGYWRDRFGANPDIIGQSVRLNDRPYTVVGVLPDDFRVTGVSSRMWRPKTGSPTDAGMGNHGGTRAMGRLTAGATAAQARAEVARILQEALPAGHGEHDASVFSRQSEETRTVRPVLIGLLVASGLLLLVACGNVAALLLGAGIDRERELAVRGAIGASRGRIFQQLISESTFLAAIGALGGVGVAAAATKVVVSLAPGGVPRLEDAALNPMVLLFAVALALLFGLGFGSIPAVSLSGQDLASSMGSSRTTGSGRTRLQSAVVVGELALATLLLVAGALLGRTVTALDRVNPGFAHEGLVVTSVAPPASLFRGDDQEARLATIDQYYQSMLDEIGAIPGVTAVAVSSVPPFFGYRGNNGVQPEGWDESQSAPMAERRFVSLGYFETLGIPIVDGRAFDRTDDVVGGAPTVIVSKGLADLAWPGESAVGKKLSHWVRDATVVGVAATIRDEDLQRETELAYYAPARQSNAVQGPFVIRTSGDPTAIIPTVRERIWSVDPDVPITRSEVMTDLMANDIAAQRFRARLMVLFAGLAGLFAMMGIYGVTTRSVARRTQEMGLRVALGADTGQVRSLVTWHAVRLAAAGVAAGLIAAVAVGGVLERFLWGISRFDPVTFATVAIALPLFAAITAIPPARRATKVSPLVALKAE